ncbi:MAG: hypothetical protein RBT24_09640 [Arcobacteraceae bacterium]|jgi:hypothetical protein|nr:hypothetical protein [Arcobacteraceae bacterium]
MKKQNIKIINFLHLEKEKYNHILEYRNQKYIREVSQSNKIITKEEHQNYFELLKKKDNYFAFLIMRDNKDFGVISLKKITEDTYFIGDYLVNELFKFEGGGIVNRICISYIANKLNIQYLKTTQNKNNTRSNRAGGVKTLSVVSINDDFNDVTASVDDFYSPETLNSKPRILFDKLYMISEFIV